MFSYIIHVAIKTEFHFVKYTLVFHIWYNVD